MIITVARDSGLFPESICDLINIKSQRLNTLVDQMNVPPIAYKENRQPYKVDFSPVSVVWEEPIYYPPGGPVEGPIPGAKVVHTLKINKMKNASFKIGEVYMVKLIFSDIFAETRAIVPEQEDAVFPAFESQKDTSFKLASIERSPSRTLHFTATPLNPSKEENPLAVRPLGDILLGKIKANDYDIFMNGRILNKATLSVNFFFIV